MNSMKKVLLVSNYVYHYRISNYDYFHKRFRDVGVYFQVLTNNKQDVDFNTEVPIVVKKPGIVTYLRYIIKEKPDCVFIFLHLRDYYIFPIVFYCRVKGIPVVYWNFGIDLGDPYNTIKNFLYRTLHRLCNAILLYSPNELTFIRPRLHSKTFVANNTVNMTMHEGLHFESNYLKDHYGIKEKYVVLFVGRIVPVKRVNELIKCFRNNPDIAVVVAGKGMTDDLKEIIDKQPNYYYLGEIKYDRQEIEKIYAGSDIVCIPGNVGLGIVESFFWGKPLVTLINSNGFNSPEIWYLKDGKNGIIAKDTADMEKRITELLNDPVLYRQFSHNARETAMGDAHISKMYEGFEKVVKFLLFEQVHVQEP